MSAAPLQSSPSQRHNMLPFVGATIGLTAAAFVALSMGITAPLLLAAFILFGVATGFAGSALLITLLSEQAQWQLLLRAQAIGMAAFGLLITTLIL